MRRREARLAAIREAKERLEAAARAADDARGRQPGQDRNPKGGPPYKRAYGEPDEKAQSNFTDPESSIMKTSNEGFQQCYNAQVAVDAEQQLVVATDLTANASDQGELPVLLDAVKATFDVQPATVLADAGYCNERDLTDLEKRGVDGYVAPGREGKQTATRDLEKHPATGRMVEKLATPAGRATYAERKWLSEAPYGWIKHVLGFRRFSLRGLAKVRCEWDLVCLALNVKRLHVLIVRPRGAHVTHTHDGFRLRIRQRPDQHAVDDAEHRRVGADPQRQDEHHRGREAGTRRRLRTAWRTSRPRSSSQRQPQTSRVRSRIRVALPSLRRLHPASVYS